MLMLRELASIGRNLIKVLGFFYAPLLTVLALLHYPYNTDPSISRPRAAVVRNDAQKFYETAYQANTGSTDPDSLYVQVEKEAAQFLRVRERVEGFVKHYDLSKRKVLEVGSGTGSLQDIVSDYTGLDIASNVTRYYHRPFVVASATDMPFADNTFDAIWTIWVLEHIPEPERALMEMRRVLKPGGILLLHPAWNCPTWLGQGYEVRPYRHFGLGGKIIKASIPFRKTAPLVLSSMVPIRVIRLAHYEFSGENTRLRFRALEPNYDRYWTNDSDAAVSVDSFEAMMWFRSRGDECLSCGSARHELFEFPESLVVQIRKEPKSHTNTQARQ